MGQLRMGEHQAKCKALVQRWSNIWWTKWKRRRGGQIFGRKGGKGAKVVKYLVDKEEKVVAGKIARTEGKIFLPACEMKYSPQAFSVQ